MIGICTDGAALDPHVAELLSLTRCLRVIGHTEPPAYEAGGLFVFNTVISAKHVGGQNASDTATAKYNSAWRCGAVRYKRIIVSCSGTLLIVVSSF